MNKYIKVFSIILLMVFSFYYTEKVALYVQNNTPLKKEIQTYKENNSIDFVNAELNGNYITPGINGLEVNVDKSYNKMKTINVFSVNYLVYDQTKPKISISNFKDKIINKGNIKRNGVSLIIKNNKELINYFQSNHITYDLFDETFYCIKIKDNLCNNTTKQIVEPTMYLNNINFLSNINSISKGYIIFIDNDVSLNYIYVLINHIKYNNFNIYKLNDHLSENYSI